MTGDDVEAMYRRSKEAALALPSALEYVERALHAGQGRSSFRLIEVVCPRDHRILEVFPSPSGPVVLGRRRQQVAFPDTPMTGPFLSRDRRRKVALLLDGQPQIWPIRAQCQCQEHAIPTDWIQLRLRRQGERRFIWDPEG